MTASRASARVVEAAPEAAHRLIQVVDLAGGAEGNRTPDLCSAIAALSHLSYSPAPPAEPAPVDVGRGRAAPLAACFAPCNRLSRHSFGPPICVPQPVIGEERRPSHVRFSPLTTGSPPAPLFSPGGGFMAYDRYDTRETPRDEGSRRSNDRFEDRGRENRGQHGRGEDRGFFERAGDEIASWFGDDDAERRRRHVGSHEERDHGRGTWTSGGERERDRGSSGNWERDRRSAHEGGQDRGFSDRAWERSGGRGYAASERDYNPGLRSESRSSRGFERDRQLEQGRDYRPVTGDYGRGGHESEQFFAASGVGRGQRGFAEEDRFASGYGRDEDRRGALGGSPQS